MQLLISSINLWGLCIEPYLIYICMYCWINKYMSKCMKRQCSKNPNFCSIYKLIQRVNNQSTLLISTQKCNHIFFLVNWFVFLYGNRSFWLSICRQLRKTYINGGINPKNNPMLIWLWTHSTCVLVGSANLSWTPEF